MQPPSYRVSISHGPLVYLTYLAVLKITTVTFPSSKYSICIKKKKEDKNEKTTTLLLVSPVWDKSLMVQGSGWAWEERQPCPKVAASPLKGKQAFQFRSTYCEDYV